ncbi:MAG: iron ABC transporter permease [Candidatus Omnitrophota bacterium]|nr:iron ABC transporter permease [Candidatus Omnitrophota bacterium]
MSANLWRVPTIFFALIVLIPLGVLFSSFLTPTGEIWTHLSHYVLGAVLRNTLWLVLGVGVGTCTLGVSLAWLTSCCDFPGRRFFSWSLILPLAIPAYVIAFVMIGLLDFSGPIQTAWREWQGASPSWLPPIRSRGGVIFVMTLALYPYVYLLSRNAFQTQGVKVMEAAQSLGCSPWQAFWRVSMPMARPWILGGVTLVLMETLADFGAVSIFNYDTLTTAIYKTWFGMFSLPAAAQLSSLLVLMVFAIVLVEQRLRPARRVSDEKLYTMKQSRFRVEGPKKWLCLIYAGLVLGMAFLMPFCQLIYWACGVMARDLDWRYLGLLSHTVLLACVAGLLIAGFSFVLTHSVRRCRDGWSKLLVRVATLGYALPGTVLAVGVYMSMVWCEKQIAKGVESVFHVDLPMLFTGTIAAMLLAYTVRFMAVAFYPVESAMNRFTESMEEAGRSLGASGARLVRKVELPMLREGILAACLLVMVEVMKEMPITLMTRPFGWDTLAVRIFELTSEGEWQRAALPAVVMVLVGLIPVFFLNRPQKAW